LRGPHSRHGEPRPLALRRVGLARWASGTAVSGQWHRRAKRAITGEGQDRPAEHPAWVVGARADPAFGPVLTGARGAPPGPRERRRTAQEVSRVCSGCHLEPRSGAFSASAGPEISGEAVTKAKSAPTTSPRGPAHRASQRPESRLSRCVQAAAQIPGVREPATSLARRRHQPSVPDWSEML
jgi:hypothetical protein